VGGVEYRKTTLMLLSRKKAKATHIIHKLRSNDAFMLLKTCINPRMVYTTRVNHPQTSMEALQSFDSSVDRALYLLCNARGFSETSHLDQLSLRYITNIRSLPLDLGGLAVMQHAGLHGEYNYILEFTIRYDRLYFRKF
jgi:hypothetical protein